MNTIFTFFPPDRLKQDLISRYPNQNFIFYSDIEEAEQDLANAEVLVTYGEDLTEEHIKKAEKLKWIMVTSAGLEKMPLQAIKAKDILVTNARGIHKIPMAEFTIGLILQQAKLFPVMQRQQKEHVWKKGLPIKEIHQQTILIVGAGAIGGEIGRLAKAFGMRVIGVNKSGKKLEHFDQIVTMHSLDDYLKDADFIVNILPSTADTRHFYQKSHFENMKKTAVFINIGRGDAVNTELLLEVMRNHIIEHAYLDVFEEEPLPQDHPFWSMDNITITPHISSNTIQYLPRAFEIFMHNFHIYTSNKPESFINVIDLERGY